MTIYLRFINQIHILEEAFFKAHSIDQRGGKLLETISIQHSLDQSLMTTDLMTRTQFGSPSVIHRSLWTLRNSGLVLVFHKGADRRAKYLRPSDIAKSYYSQLGAALIEAVRDDS